MEEEDIILSLCTSFSTLFSSYCRDYLIHECVGSSYLPLEVDGVSVPTRDLENYESNNVISHLCL